MPTVLLVEDEPDLRLLLTMTLSRYQLTIVQASSIAEAMTKWEQADLVLLDIRLPDGSGLELLDHFRPGRPPVIAMSAHAGIDMKSAALNAGCVDYLTKPFGPNSLQDTVVSHLELCPK